MTTSVSTDDIRAAVAAGVLSEAQAAHLTTIAEARAGYRDHMPVEDEPFELFRGFSEIFVTVGLVILFAGIAAMTLIFWQTGNRAALPVIGAGLAWLFAEYFTRKRRMSLPSVFLTITFGTAAAAFIVFWFNIPEMLATSAILGPDPSFIASRVLTIAAAGLAAILLWYWRFRVPFAMFVAGLFGCGIVFALTAMLQPEIVSSLSDPTAALFDLGSSSSGAIAMLTFGLITFFAAMTFDLADPHRISLRARSGFWLHVLAAPALVNTTVYTFISMGGTLGAVLSVGSLACVTLLALLIDRRSFLTAGLIYIAIILGAALDRTGSDAAGILTLLILGATITALGAFWTETRSVLMRTIPDFPGKSRLPPYPS